MLKRLGVFAAAFAVLAAAAAFLWRRGSAVEENAPLARWSVGQIVSVELAHSGERLILKKKAGRWGIVEPSPGKADALAAESLAGALHDVRLGAVVSRDPAQAGAYGLADLGATRVKVFVENLAAPALDGAFGAPALGGTALYFRAERDDRIMLAQGVPVAALMHPAAYYRARK